MRLTVVLGFAVVSLSMPALASTGEFGHPSVGAGQTVSVRMQFATLEGPLGIAHEIMRQLSLQEGDEALYEGEERARVAEELLDPPDEHEEHFEHHFKCHLQHLIGAKMECVHPD